MADFNFAFALLQIPLGIIGVPLGIVVLPTLSRDAAVGHETVVRGAADPGAAAPDLRHGPDRRADRDRPRSRSSRSCSGAARSRQPDLDLIAATLAFFADRADRARADRGPRPGVLRAPGHGHAGRSPRSRAVVINCSLAVVLVGPYGLQGIALAIAVAAWIEALALLAILHRRLPHFELRGLARVGVEAVVGSALAGAVAVRGRSGGSAGALGADPGRLVLRRRGRRSSSLVFGLVYAALSLVLRIPELPSIVGVMADVLRRPARS